MLFISHSAADNKAAADLKRRAVELGYSHAQLFLDCDAEVGIPAGAIWERSIYDRLKKCSALIVVFSPRFSESKWCFAELIVAKTLGKPIFPVVIEECTLDAILHEHQAVFPYREGEAAFERLWNSLERTEISPDGARRERAPLRDSLLTSTLQELTVTPRSGNWVRSLVSPLQAARKFVGRDGVLAEITSWVADPDNNMRVLAVVAPAGTGKTSLAAEVLRNADFIDCPAGVFSWDFLHNPKTEAFLRAACEYFFGETPSETGGLLERLQRGLRADGLPHIFVLDGLELVQANATGTRQHGEIENPLMKRFLHWLATGHGTRAKALITSRFTLPDLEAHSGCGFRHLYLPNLNVIEAISLMRGLESSAGDWYTSFNIGTDDHLREILEYLQESREDSFHALSVSLLASLLIKQCNDNPTAVPSFDASVITSDDGYDSKISRILSEYNKVLSDCERDLMVRISLMPNGATLESLETVICAGGEVAGSLVACNRLRLRTLLDGLCNVGLVFATVPMRERKFRVHSLVGTFFRSLEAAPAGTLIHRALWRAAGYTRSTDVFASGDWQAYQLMKRCNQPHRHRDGQNTLDWYEQQLELSRATGNIGKCRQLYERTLGRLYELSNWDYAHGCDREFHDELREFRILSWFFGGIVPSEVTRGVDNWESVVPILRWGEVAAHLGDLTIARRAFEICRNKYEDEEVVINYCVAIEAMAGRWKALGDIARISARVFGGQSDSERNEYYGYDALAAFQLGQTTDIRCVNEGHRRMYCRRALAESDITDRRGLEANIAWACNSGEVKSRLHCYLAAAEFERSRRHYAIAISEAMDGIQLADSCGFGAWSLDIRTELATIHLAAGNPKAAIEPAQWVLKRSEEEDCCYAWGIADSLHQLGIAYSQAGFMPRARDYLHRAVDLRRRLKHHAVKESEEALSGLVAQ